ncbi:uncharacterized protein, partial [Eucyclogobius newberryi]|uniref:uncharacterized protein n=1 Tax=Eucyclogobius newberryi TaxID=166745 RepID=UPI003B5C8CAD
MTMASVSVAGPQQQQPGPQRARTQEPLLIFGVKKTLLPRKTSWEKMVFRRSSVSDKPAQTAPAAAAAAPGLHGGVTPAEGARTRQDIPGGVLDLSMKRTVTANGHVSTSTGADCRTSSPQNVSMNGRADCGGAGDVSGGPGDVSGGPGDVFGGPGDVSGAPGDVFGSSLPSLERLTRGKTGVVKLARAETHRREAWAIFPAEVTVVEDPRVKTGQGHMSEDPRVKTETGQGHRFEARAVREDWCDACSRQVHTRALKCHNCSYTCHLECESHVQLDCNQGDRKHERTPPPRILCSTPPQPKVKAPHVSY